MANVNQQQLDGIGARFDKGFDEIKNLMRSFDERIRAIELREAGCSPLLLKRIVDTENKLSEQGSKIEELRMMITTQAGTAEKLSKAVETINGWGRWAAYIASALMISGLVFFIGRLIFLSITGDLP